MTVLFLAVSYKSAENVSALLRSLQAGTSGDWRLVIANNSGPYDGTLVERIADGDERVEYFDTGGNLGYFGAAAAAFSVYGQPLPSWTVVLNTDLILHPSFVRTLSALDSETYGAVAPRIINTRTGQDQNPFMRERPGRAQRIRRRIMLGNRISAQAALATKAIAARLRPHGTGRVTSPGVAIYAAHGSVLVLSRSYFDAGGDLKHPLFLFGEELYVADMCERFGLPIVYRPDLEALHNAHAQTGTLRSWRMLGHMTKASRFIYGVCAESRRPR